MSKSTKKTASRKAKKPTGNVKFVKLSKLSKSDIAKINLDELWIMKPIKEKAIAAAKKKPLRLCGGKDTCIA